ncbi:MAG: hypothetical protein ABSD20_17190 [Terriglobales bacterium]|jgi:hypothetical protein
MDADFAVELGPPSEEAVLELPWDSGTPEGPRFLDLKRQPELLLRVEEANRYPELGQFLKSINSPASRLASAKCDVWSTDSLDEAEEIFGTGWKLGSYVDLVFSEEYAEQRFSFPAHETLARSLVALLKKAPEMPARCEALVRRCYYHDAPAAEEPNSQPGFYISVYVLGYGKDAVAARRQWHIALQLAANAALQLQRN